MKLKTSFRMFLSVFLLLSSLLVSLLSSPIANAASAYDSTVTSGGEQYISSAACGRTDLGSASSVFNNQSLWAGGLSSSYTQYHDAFQSALNRTVGWGETQVTQLQPNSSSFGYSATVAPGDKFLKLYFNTDGNAHFVSDPYGKRITQASTGQWYSVWIYYESGTCTPKVVQKYDGNGIYYALEGIAFDNTSNSEASNYSYKPVYLNYNITYPTGYEGSIPPSSSIPPTKVYPNIKYEIDNKTITAVYDNNIPTMTACGTGAVGYSLSKVNADETLTQVDFKPASPNCEPYVFTVTTNGNYVLLAVASKPVPFAPFPDDIDVQPTYLSFKFDGSVQSGNTGTDDCTNGNCIPQPIFEDCSVYGANLVAGFGCVISNFGIYLRNLLTFLFVPKSTEVMSAINSFNTNTHNIAAVIALPITSIAKLTTAQCSPVQITFPFTNRVITYPCLTPVYAQALGGTWTMLQVLLTGAVAYGVTINSLALVKRMKDPQDDKIEVFTL